MQNVATDLAQMLGIERVLWEQEHLVTYGFDGTAALYGEAGCIVLCLVQMDRVLELDPKNLTIHVQSGVVTQKVAELAGAPGLLYPPDPGSMRISTIGGNVAENSGGLRGLKYGVTRDYVMGLEVVLANGETFFTGNKCVKDVAGYSLKDIFIGSE